MCFHFSRFKNYAAISFISKKKLQLRSVLRFIYINKKAHRGKPDELNTIFPCLLSFDLTYLFPTCRDGIGTLSRLLTETGCQGFIGPRPSAFLDK